MIQKGLLGLADRRAMVIDKGQDRRFVYDVPQIDRIAIGIEKTEIHGHKVAEFLFDTDPDTGGRAVMPLRGARVHTGGRADQNRDYYDELLCADHWAMFGFVKSSGWLYMCLFS